MSIKGALKAQTGFQGCHSADKKVLNSIIGANRAKDQTGVL